MEPKVPEWAGRHPNLYGLAGGLREAVQPFMRGGLADVALSRAVGYPTPEFMTDRELMGLSVAGIYKTPAKWGEGVGEKTPLTEQKLINQYHPSAQKAVAEGNTYYHSTSAEAAKSIEQNGFKAQIGERSLGVANAKGVWLYEDAGATTEFGKNFTRAGKTPAVVETKVSGKIFDATNDERSIRGVVEDKKLIAKLKSEGYVGVKGDELGTSATFVFDTTALKTKSQLTTVFNEAKGATPPTFGDKGKALFSKEEAMAELKRRMNKKGAK